MDSDAHEGALEAVEHAVEKAWRAVTQEHPCPTPGCTEDRVVCPNVECLELGPGCPTCDGEKFLCPVCDARAWEQNAQAIHDATQVAITRATDADAGITLGVAILPD